MNFIKLYFSWYFQVTLTNRSTIRESSVTFGAFGYCNLDIHTTDGTDADLCSSRSIGYDIAGVVTANTHPSTAYTSSTLKDLTRALILHPISTAVVFIAFLIAALSHRLGFLFSSVIAAIAFILVLVTLIIDFTIFGSVKSHVNGDGSGSTAAYSVGIWVTLAAFVLVFLGSLTTCFSCFTDRRRSRNAGNNY